MTALVLGWSGYRAQTKKRWGIGFGELSQVSARLFWLAFAIPTMFIAMMPLATPIGILPVRNSVFAQDFYSLHTPLNYQSVLLASLANVQLFYFVLRIFRNPHFLRILSSRCQQQFANGVTLATRGV